MREGTTSRVMAAGRPYYEFYDFYTFVWCNGPGGVKVDQLRECWLHINDRDPLKLAPASLLNVRLYSFPNTQLIRA
jgi:hypothetical protein